MQLPRRTPEEIIVLVLCAICVAGLLPFSFIRLERGDWFVASIDTIGFIGSSIAFLYVFKARQVGFAGTFLACLALGGMVLNVYALGARDLYFFYPVVMVTYFLVKPNVALAMTTAALIVLSIALEPAISLFDFAKFLLSVVGCMLFAYVFATQRNRQRDQLIRQSTVDPLTGAGNRRALHEKLEELIASHQRTGAAMSLIILDLDNFKEINDKAGHLVGDEVLKLIAATVETRIRATDSLYRYGGDEFIILATSADVNTAAKLAEDIRQLIDQYVKVEDLQVTVSIGVAEFGDDDNPEIWLSKADAAMYNAKQSGRNTVSVEPTFN